MAAALGIIVLMCMAVTLAIAAQHRRDLSELRTVVDEKEVLRTVKDKQSTAKRVTCTLPSGETGNCTALRYKISTEECVKLLRAVGSQKDNSCHNAQDVVARDKTVALQIGGIYNVDGPSPPGMYATLVKRDKNLLWKYW